MFPSCPSASHLVTSPSSCTKRITVAQRSARVGASSARRSARLASDRVRNTARSRVIDIALGEGT
eukprot:11697053-Alexandrium_andersonii.AAC.1